MSFKLSIFNPSERPRIGHITIPWKPIYEKTRIPVDEFALEDNSGNVLPVQVDSLDPNDPSQATLIFSLTQPIHGGPHDYSNPSDFLNIKRGKKVAGKTNKAYLEVKKEKGVIKLGNGQLEVWFNLQPEAGGEWGKWYAGAVTSVLKFDDDAPIYNKEILDPFPLTPEGHDPEKRCMQVDRILLTHSTCETTGYQGVYLFNQPYKLISTNLGPIRVSITAASTPFDYSYSDPTTNREYTLKCNLYRVISLYIGTDYVTEELFIKGIPKWKNNTKAIDLYFKAFYFTHAQLGWEPQICQSPHIPDWFAIGSSSPPCAGYGFATDVHAGPVIYPHWNPENPDPTNAYRRFSWQLGFCKLAKCVHLFMRGQPGVFNSGYFDSKIGHLWYESIYKPLRAEII